MNSARNPFRRRLVLLLAALAVLAVALAGPRQPAASAAVCNAASVDYYSDATYTTVVGNCTHGCCQNWVCTGTLTQYSVVVYKETCQ